MVVTLVMIIVKNGSRRGGNSFVLQEDRWNGLPF